MFIKNNVKLGGIVSMCKHKDEKDVPVLAPFNNLILNTFIDTIYAGNGNFFDGRTSGSTAIGVGTRVGSGTLPPDVTDTSLVNPLLVSNGIHSTVSDLTYDEVTDEYVLTRTTRTEYAPAVSNVNLTELGVYTNTTSSPTVNYPMVSRTLLKDGLGDPTTITLETGEILVVFYTFVCRIPRTLNAQAVIKGVTSNLQFTLHMSSPNSYTDFPFAYPNPMGYMGTHTAVTSNVFTPPIPFTAVSKSGWVFNNGGGSLQTPLNTATGLKIRGRLSLDTSVMNNITAIAYSQQFNNFAADTFVSIDPPFNKTNQDVIDIEMITTFTRA